LQTKIAPPLIVELGKIARNDALQLRMGNGPVADDVEEVMRLVRTQAPPEREDTVLLPIVVLYTKAQQK
jgi:hypothetical protein